MLHPALIPGLMGDSFAALHPQVQAVHSGSSSRWQGTATVQRGNHPLLRIAATFAGLPASQRDVTTVVTVAKGNGHEVWTRQFGSAAPLRSTLSASNGQLVERLGLVTMYFRIEAIDGAMNWRLQRIACLGLPLPLRCFQVHARADAGGRGYRFSVAVRVTGVGDLIRYDGVLDVAL